MSVNKYRYSPIAIFLYNRPDSTERLFDSIFHMPLFENSLVYVFVDGPRNEYDRIAIGKIRSFVSQLKHDGMSVVYSEHNKGLQKSVYDGVSYVCNLHDTVIVLEDDLVLSNLALQYFNDGLSKYANDESVYSICGYMTGNGLRDLSSAVLIPYTHPWGWATWSSRWKRFIIDPDSTRKYIESVFFRRQFNFNGLNNYSLMLKLANSGSIDSWYIYWYLFVLLNRGVSVFPPRTYVINMGDAGTHSSKYNPLKYVLKNKKLLDKVVRIPDSTAINYAAVDTMASCFESRVQRISAALGAMKRYCKDLLSNSGLPK